MSIHIQREHMEGKENKTNFANSISRIVKIICVVLVMVLMLGSRCTKPAPSNKDLVVQSFKILIYKWLALGGVEAEVEVVVANVGNSPASTFNVGIVAVNREGNYVQFVFSYDPALTSELAPGQEVTLSSTASLSWHGFFDITCAEENYDPALCAMHDEKTLWVKAIVDYCEVDGMPAYCAVQESNEANNTSNVVVIEKTSTVTPVPPIPPTATCNYDMSFVADISIPDDTVILAGQSFVKTWRILNSGDCFWPSGTTWVFADGNQMGSTNSVPVTTADPGTMVDVSVNLIAPNSPGTYTGYWTLRFPDGMILYKKFFVRIVVPVPSPTPTSVPPQPLVILMDGSLKDVVYQPETFEAGGTNADDIAKILANLPIVVIKETTSLRWQREQQILEQNPDLIIIHTSAFYEPGGLDNTKFSVFLQSMQNARTKFLIYSRGSGFQNEENTKKWFETQYPFLQGHVDVLFVPGGPGARWDIEGVAEKLLNKVRLLLGL